MAARMDRPPHARAGQIERGHRFAAYPRCSTDNVGVRGGSAMRTGRGLLVAGFAGLTMLVSGDARCQARVLLIRPEARTVVPADAVQTFKQAVFESLPDVRFVRTMAEASDLIEFTDYGWAFDEKLGVTQTWRFSYRPLDYPEELPSGRSRPINMVLTVPGETLAESTRLSIEMLRERFRRLLTRFEPKVAK